MKKAGSSLAEIEKVGILTVPRDKKKNFPREYGGQLKIMTPGKQTKAELIPSPLKMMGYDLALDYEEQVRPGEGEFHLTFGRVGYHTHARTQDNIWTADFMRENELWIHPEAAKQRGINQGDVVQVRDRKGRTDKIKAKVTIRIRKDTVFMVHGFGHWDERMTTAKGQGAADSNLASYEQDPRIGSMSMGLSMVTVEKA
jgi:thiosulfate reductase/polysulfide reductase chain A